MFMRSKKSIFFPWINKLFDNIYELSKRENTTYNIIGMWVPPTVRQEYANSWKNNCCCSCFFSISIYFNFNVLFDLEKQESAKWYQRHLLENKISISHIANHMIKNWHFSFRKGNPFVLFTLIHFIHCRIPRNTVGTLGSQNRLFTSNK